MTGRPTTRHRRRPPEEIEDWREQLQTLKTELELEESQDFKFDPSSFRPETPRANRDWKQWETADLARRHLEHVQACRKVGCSYCARALDNLDEQIRPRLRAA